QQRFRRLKSVVQGQQPCFSPNGYFSELTFATPDADINPIAAPSPRGSAPPVNRIGLPLASYSIVSPCALPRLRTRMLWPIADNSFRTDSGTLLSTEITSGSAKLMRGAAIAC